MSSTVVREVLLRALFDYGFNNKLVTDPDDALREYDLTDDEKAAIKAPTAQLYALVEPELNADQVAAQLAATTTQPVTVVVTIVIVVAIVVFVAATTPDLQALQAGRREKYQPLLASIRKASGAERFDLVRTLISDLMAGR